MMRATGVMTTPRPAPIRALTLHRHRSTPSRSATTTETRPAAQGRRRQNPHGPQAPQQKGVQDLRPAQGDRRTGERTDQGGTRLAPLSAARHREGQWRVAPDRRHSQPAQVIQVPAITAASAGGSNRMKGSGPGQSSQGCDSAPRRRACSPEEKSRSGSTHGWRSPCQDGFCSIGNKLLGRDRPAAPPLL